MAEEPGDEASEREPSDPDSDAPDSPDDLEPAVTAVEDEPEPAVTPAEESELEPAVERVDDPEGSSTEDLNAAWGLSGEDHDTPPAPGHEDLDDEAVTSPAEMDLQPDAAGDESRLEREEHYDPDAVDDGDDPDEYEPPEFRTEPPEEMEPDWETEAPTDGGYADGTEQYEEFDPGTGSDIHEGAPDDEEMPLADHIEEMVRRLGVVVVVMAIVSAITFPFGAELINFLWFSYLPGSIEACPEAASRAVDITEGLGGSACPRVYHPLALILARLKVATLAGFVVALPVFVYETYLFMRPGLYPHERRYYLASVPTSLVLAGIGVLFAHLLVLPALFTYFLYYSDDAAVIAFGLSETFDLITLLLGGFAFIFQIPLFIMLALMMGLVTRRWMTERRLLFWGAFAGLAFLFSPDPTGMAPIIVAATMIVLFEGTLLLAKWTGRG